MVMLLDGLACALMIAAAVSDIRSYRIPNWVSAMIVVLFAVRTLIDPAGLVASLTVGAVVLAAGFVLFTTRLLGAGDAKLLAALSLWVGPALIFEFLTATALAGGVAATAILFFRKGAGTPALASASPGCMGSHESDAPEINGKRVSTPMPYGVAIAAGGLWCVARHYLGS
jgi:prepilin peptidase CpaA